MASDARHCARMGLEVVNAGSCREMTNSCRSFPYRTFTQQAERDKVGNVLPTEARGRHKNIKRFDDRPLNE